MTIDTTFDSGTTNSDNEMTFIYKNCTRHRYNPIYEKFDNTLLYAEKSHLCRYKHTAVCPIC